MTAYDNGCLAMFMREDFFLGGGSTGPWRIVWPYLFPVRLRLLGPNLVGDGLAESVEVSPCLEGAKGKESVKHQRFVTTSRAQPQPVILIGRSWR